MEKNVRERLIENIEVTKRKVAEWEETRSSLPEDRQAPLDEWLDILRTTIERDQEMVDGWPES